MGWTVLLEFACRAVLGLKLLEGEGTGTAQLDFAAPETKKKGGALRSVPQHSFLTAPKTGSDLSVKIHKARISDEAKYLKAQNRTLCC
jgi:hypothetical protein